MRGVATGVKENVTINFFWALIHEFYLCSVPSKPELAAGSFQVNEEKPMLNQSKSYMIFSFQPFIATRRKLQVERRKLRALVLPSHLYNARNLWMRMNRLRWRCVVTISPVYSTWCSSGSGRNMWGKYSHIAFMIHLFTELERDLALMVENPIK